MSLICYKLRLSLSLLPSVPLIVNFGSCTWPPFMASLARISRIQQRWADRATFLTIYIQGNYKYFDMYCKSINIASRYSLSMYFQKHMQRRRRSLKIHYSRLKLTRVSVKDWRRRVRMTNDVFTFHCCTATSASKRSIRKFVITEKAPTRAFSWLKAATTAFTFKTL